MKNFINLDVDNVFSGKARKIIESKYIYHNKSINDIVKDKSIKDFHVIFPKLIVNLESKILEKFKNLEIIVSNTTGLNHIDLEYCKRKNIRVISLSKYPEFLKTIWSSAEHTWALLMNVNKRINESNNYLKLNEDWDRNKFITNDLNGKNIGIIGLGRNGNKLAQYASAFGMNISYYDIVDKKNDFQYKSLVELLQWSEYLILSLPLNNKTEKLIDNQILEYAKDDLVMINTSRGEVVDEDAIINSLKNGKLKHYASDVLTGEVEEGFLNKSSLYQYFLRSDNVTLTPHIGGANQDSWEKTEIFLAEKLIQIS